MDTSKSQKRQSRRITSRKLRRAYIALNKVVDKMETRKQKAIVNNEEDIINGTKRKLLSIEKDCKIAFGYAANPDLPLWNNTENALYHQSPEEYFSRPNKMAYHDLCTNRRPPAGIGSTLGLGLKFCVQTDQQPKSFSKSFERFTNDV